MKPSDSVHVAFKKMSIETYEPKPEMNLPFFFEKKPYQGASGKLYPLHFTDGLNNEKKEKEYLVGVLENSFIRVEVLPTIGGKVLRGYDKIGKYDFIYHNSVIKPAMIGLAGPWISGGIEFNWPQHHRPTTFMPVSSSIEQGKDGEVTIWMGEVEPFQDMKGEVGITLRPGCSRLEAKVRVSNDTALPHPFMWWSNLAVPFNENYQIIFPPDVEWVNDHDRRAVISWPVAKGIYQTARPFDFGDGTDISFVRNIKVPSSYMVSEGQSKMDFVSGYDHGRQMGIVAVGDHRVVTGKKLWCWGHGPFGEKWCSNLTDADGQYVELMTGAFTDNQPDFTWIMPGEERTFMQYWFPIRRIGGVKNASRDLALNMERRGDELYVGIQPSAVFSLARIVLRNQQRVVWKQTVDFDPSSPILISIPWKETWDMRTLSCEITDKNGGTLLSYQQPERGGKTPILPRLPALSPKEIDSTEMLFVNGLHLEQYKQHNFDPEAYYQEALSRDPLDIRCNTAMARISMSKGRFEDAVAYCEMAEKRLLARNTHPADAEACYLHGLALCGLHKFEDAEQFLIKGAWNGTWKVPSLFQLAIFATKRKEWNRAMEYLQDGDKEMGGFLQGAILLAQGKRKEATTLAVSLVVRDKLSVAGRSLLFLANTKKSFGIVLANKDLLPYWNVLVQAGFMQLAQRLLAAFPQDSSLVRIYRAFLIGEKPDYRNIPEKEEFPSHVEDYAILSAFSRDAEAQYLLGCLCYHHSRYDEAFSAWNNAVVLDPSKACAWRCLAIAAFDKRNDKEGARRMMETAFSLDTHNPRILYEFQQLLKNYPASDKVRLSLYRQNMQVMEQRDDCVLDFATLLTKQGEYTEAERVLEERTFHIYEGGEGKITQLHAWLHVLHALKFEQDGENGKAEEEFMKATVIPDTYGEAKSYFAQEGHIYYLLGRLLQNEGRNSEDAYHMAAEPKSAVTELSLFRALALRELGEWETAECVLKEMYTVAEERLAHPSKYPYYGVGSPTPMPFEYDVVKSNLVSGSLLAGYALYGLGRKTEAERALQVVRDKDPWNFMLAMFEKVVVKL